MLGMIFDLDKSNVMRDIRYLEPAIKQSIPIPAKKYADAKKLKTVQELQRFFPELIVITDGTEQPIPRPKDRTKKIALFRQKENTHTVQNQITVNLDGVIIHKSAHSTGSHHDYKIYKAKHPYCLRSCYNFMILGIWEFKGFPDQISIIPYKKKKYRELSTSQKEWNRSQSKIRIKVEHVICSNQEI